MTNDHSSTPAAADAGQTEENEPPVVVGSSAWFASVFPKGESRSVNVGSEKKPCWVIEGPERTAEDIAWTRSIVDALHPVRTTDAGVVSGGKIAPDEIE
jgi:hypothetical protein